MKSIRDDEIVKISANAGIQLYQIVVNAPGSGQGQAPQGWHDGKGTFYESITDRRIQKIIPENHPFGPKDN